LRKRPSQLGPRTLEYYRSRGYHIGRVEQTVPYGFIKIDLFHLFDFLCFHPARVGVIGVQVTSTPHMNDREQKMRTNPILKGWLRSEHREAVILGWSKKGARGKRKLWTPCIRRLDNDQ